MASAQRVILARGGAVIALEISFMASRFLCALFSGTLSPGGAV
jgi:hypothetical protein